MKTKLKYKNYSFIFFTVSIIIICTFFSLNNFNKKVTPNLLNVAESSVDKLNESVLMNYKVSQIYKNVDLNNVILLNKNNNGEIIDVDFKLENVYEALSVITNYIKEELENNDNRQKYLNDYNEIITSNTNNVILSIPMGIESKYIYFANLGPKIPVKISYMDYIATGIRLKLDDYGINNVLISIYIDCSITNEIIIPISNKKINHEYSILIASRIIEGSIPEYYGGSYETKSNILNIPID